VDPATSTSHHQQEIVVEGVVKKFGDKLVLDGVGFTVERGEMVAIIGGSGCGKTVLIRVITGHFAPDAGRVEVANHEIPGSPLRDLSTVSEAELDELRRHWAVVFQRNALFSGSVYENLALWPKEVKCLTDDEVTPLAVKALRDVALDPEELMYADRDSLSGGMAKRLAIARALVLDPVLIFYDEPTAGLDPETGGQIHDLIESTHRATPALGVERTSIIVTHDSELISKLSPRIIMLHSGRVIFDGAFEEFVRTDHPRIRPYVLQMPSLHARVPHD